MKKQKMAVLLAGCGVYDGSEIHEAVLSLLALEEAGFDYQCIAPNKEQHHVVNHLTVEEMQPARNVLVESARIARGNVLALDAVNEAAFDGLLIPGGFGAAKNLNQWALAGPDGAIDPQVKTLILAFARAGKPIGALCMGPTVLASAFAGSEFQPQLTVGSTEAPSLYDIAAISAGMESLGSKVAMRTVDQIEVDVPLKIVSAPCYMMEAGISQIHRNARQVVEAMRQLNKI